MEDTLHAVIKDILVKSGSLPIIEIAKTISSHELWKRPSDGEMPLAKQIRARLKSYPKLFEINQGIVSIKKTSPKEERLCKLVWNTNDWIQPCERSWNPNYEEDPNKGYEQKHGFVHEDWLFNSQFLIDGYQYGYIQGVNKLNSEVKKLDVMYLFSINPNTKTRFYLGKIFDVEVLDRYNPSKKLQAAVKEYTPAMILQLKELGANVKALQNDHYKPNLRFNVNAKEIFPEPKVISSSWFAQKYYRTMPMYLTEELKQLLSSLEKSSQFNFHPSAPFGKDLFYSKQTREKKTSVTKVHQEIEEALYKHLLNSGIPKNSIACDTCSFGGKLADVVVLNPDKSYDIFEIKTDTDFRRGLRESVGQLIDYTCWENDLSIKTIYSVLPFNEIPNDINNYIQRVRKLLKIKLKVLLYNKAIGTFDEVK
jgi:hypothetical protein